MSLELVDCRFKISPVTLAILKGKAKAKGNIDVADILRALADREADEFRLTLIEAQRILAQQGLLGELQGPFGTPARFAVRAGAEDVLNLDEALE